MHRLRTYTDQNLEEGTYGDKEIIIRVNSIGTSWFAEDIKAACRSGAHAIILPEANSLKDVRMLGQEIALHSDRNLDQEIWCMIETPLDVIHAPDIVSVPSVKCLCIGTVDSANNLHCP